jgi:1,4-alpha-glucan branching enzyme
MHITCSEPVGHSYSAKNMVVPVHFFCRAPQARAVCLLGDFNSWNPTVHPMQRQVDGSWFVEVLLTHGHHQYLFLVDGTPTLDPNGSGITRNDRNERVSLIAIS